MWTLFEPVHAVTYFAPQARSAFEEAGLRGFWRGYFAGRAAPLGRAGAAVVTASFYNFAPAFAALAAADIDGCEAVVLRTGLDLRRENLQPVRPGFPGAGLRRQLRRDTVGPHAA